MEMMSDNPASSPDAVNEPRSIEQLVMEKLLTLPPDKQQEVLDFVEFLQHKRGPVPPFRSLYGLWADLGIQLTEEDIVEARRAMWGNFPRKNL